MGKLFKTKSTQQQARKFETTTEQKIMG